MLEFIYHPGLQNCCYNIESLSGTTATPSCRIFRVEDELERTGESSDVVWHEYTKNCLTPAFAPFPNLSLNIRAGSAGKSRYHHPRSRLFLFAASIGLILQGSFFIYAS
jgi:hypothetical protein